MKKNSKEKIVRIYSSALYDAVEGVADTDKVMKDVEVLRLICKQDKDLVKRMANPLISDEDRNNIWQQAAKKAGFTKETLRFLEIVSTNNRIGDLADILEDFIHLYHSGHNIAEVTVETVKELSAAQDKKLRGVLTDKLKKDVVVEYVINPALLGGLRIQSGSKMFDGSLSYKLNCLENMMKGK